MRQRLETHQGPFPAAAVYRMWREMMCAFTLMQTPDIKVAICRPHDQPGYWDLARDHFGCQITFVANDTPAQVLAAVRANPATLGVVPVPIEADSAPWWPLLAGRDATLPNIVARLPFLDMPNARACSFIRVTNLETVPLTRWASAIAASLPDGSSRPLSIVSSLMRLPRGSTPTAEPL